jgi:hypothetical protein
MTLDKNGKVDVSGLALFKLFLSMLAAAALPVGGAMLTFYGDKRVIESTQASQGVMLERHSDKLEKHESRLTTIEAKTAIEE